MCAYENWVCVEWMHVPLLTYATELTIRELRKCMLSAKYTVSYYIASYFTYSQWSRLLWSYDGFFYCEYDMLVFYGELRSSVWINGLDLTKKHFETNEYKNDKKGWFTLLLIMLKFKG